MVAIDSQNRPIAGRSTLRIDLLPAEPDPNVLFTGLLDRRGTAEAQFRLPPPPSGRYGLRYTVDTPIGSAEYTQPVPLKDQVSILLTTEKPIYQAPDAPQPPLPPPPLDSCPPLDTSAGLPPLDSLTTGKCVLIIASHDR